MPSTIVTNFNSLAALFPDIARQLHPTLNHGTTADMLTALSKRVMVWQCETDPTHAYSTNVWSRTKRKTGCNICSGKFLDPRKSLAALRPDIAQYWHPTRNGNLSPEQFPCGSHKTIWWICRSNLEHFYEAPIKGRIRSTGDCRECRNFYVTDDNRLSICFPEIAAQFHPTRNRMLYPSKKENEQWFPRNNFRPGEEPKRNRRITPADIKSTSKEVFIWRGNCGIGHEWSATVYDRTHGLGCGVCFGSQNLPTEDISLATAFPGVANMWHKTKNGSVKPTQVRPYSTKEHYFRCARFADHDFKARVQSVVRSWQNGSNGCPKCRGFDVLYRDSVAAKFPQIASMMIATDNTIDPKEVGLGSNKVASFQCPDVAYHIFEAPIARVVGSAKKGKTGCGFCSGARVHPLDSLAERYPSIAKQIDRTQSKTPNASKLLPGSHRVVTFRCSAPERHRWTQPLRDVVENYERRKIICPKCWTKQGT